MSCKDCDEYNEGQKGVAYYRWGTANIGLMGCPKHIKEVLDALNKAQTQSSGIEMMLELIGKYPTIAREEVERIHG